MTSTTGFDYTLTRDLDAPVDGVWRAWTVVEKYGRWANAEEVVMDVRPGGAWSSVMVISGGARITLSQTFDTAQDRDQAEQGSNMFLDGLTAYLAAA